MNARQHVEFLDPHEPLAQERALHHTQLQAHGVGVRLGQRELLQATTAQFAAGQVTVVLGPNGAGKSTLMSTLTGQRQPHCGHVALAGQPAKWSSFKCGSSTPVKSKRVPFTGIEWLRLVMLTQPAAPNAWCISCHGSWYFGELRGVSDALRR